MLHEENLKLDGVIPSHCGIAIPLCEFGSCHSLDVESTHNLISF
jgi:hypothetical protein